MYRGFVGSPLLGLLQGIAVYQDGVRVNEPFGDTVSWALIPGAAIDELQVLPGSDPMFGLNALGGTIVVRTKDGFSHPGARVEVSTGSFGRLGGDIELGGRLNESLASFASVSYVEEDGRRGFSGTEALQAFGSVRFEAGRSTAEAKLTFVDTDLTGNGAAPVQLLRSDRSAVFTHPDNAGNRLVMLSLVASHDLTGTTSLAGNAYVRRSDIATLNGDDSEYDPCEDDPALLCIDDEVALNTDGQPSDHAGGRRIRGRRADGASDGCAQLKPVLCRSSGS